MTPMWSQYVTWQNVFKAVFYLYMLFYWVTLTYDECKQTRLSCIVQRDGVFIHCAGKTPVQTNRRPYVRTIEQDFPNKFMKDGDVNTKG